MKKEEKYKLRFVRNENDSFLFYCDVIVRNDETNALSELLTTSRDVDTTWSIIEEIDLALLGEEFDGEIAFNVTPGDFSLTLTPPEAVIGLYSYTYKIPLVDLKELLQEWLAFISK